MKIGFCIFPLLSGHKNRGIGYYTSNLLGQLKKKDAVQVQEFNNLSELGKVDVVFYPWFDLFFPTLPLIKLAPFVVVIYDTIPLIFPKAYPVGIKGRFNFLIQKFSLQGCKFIVTISNDSKKNIVRFLNIKEEKIKAIPLAVDTRFKIISESEKIRVKRKYQLPDDFILYVGDANFVKNLPFLIEGFKLLKQNPIFKNLKLVLVNEVFLKKIIDDNHPELKPLKTTNQLIDRFLKGEVIKAGRIETEDLVCFYNLASVYVQPSLYEGFGLPVLEAMSCGCPVVSSDKGALPEVGGKAVIYFNPENIEQMVAILTNILTDQSLRTKLSKLGLEQAKKFSWERVADETIKVFQQVLER